MAVALGLGSWASLATELILEKHAAAKPFRAQIANNLQQKGLNLADWDSMDAVASQCNDHCHPGSAVTSSYLYHVAKNQKPPPGIACNQANLVKVMLYLKTRKNGL